MPFIDNEFQEYSDPQKNIRFHNKKIIASNIFGALCVIALDMFDSYESFFMPSFFGKNWQKEIQAVMVDYKYLEAASGDTELLKRLFNNLEQCFGREKAFLLLDWIKNSTDVMASKTAWALSSIGYEIKTKKISSEKIPLRLQRYFSFERLLFDQHSGGSLDMDVESIKTQHDKRLYLLQEFDGEISFQPDAEAAALFRNLACMIAWENACHEGRPDAEEINDLSIWLAEHSENWRTENHSLNDIYLTPLLRNEYIKNKIIISV